MEIQNDRTLTANFKDVLDEMMDHPPLSAREKSCSSRGQLLSPDQLDIMINGTRALGDASI